LNQLPAAVAVAALAAGWGFAMTLPVAEAVQTAFDFFGKTLRCY